MLSARKIAYVTTIRYRQNLHLNQVPVYSRRAYNRHLHVDLSLIYSTYTEPKYRFASPEATKAPANKTWNAPTIKGLTDGVKDRDVRVHDCSVYAGGTALCH